jgi:hypothetical protein
MEEKKKKIADTSQIARRIADKGRAMRRVSSEEFAREMGAKEANRSDPGETQEISSIPASYEDIEAPTSISDLAEEIKLDLVRVKFFIRMQNFAEVSKWIGRLEEKIDRLI